MKAAENINTGLDNLLERAEKIDWSYTISTEDKRNYVELYKYSPLGEDFSVIIDFDTDNPEETFLINLGKCYFDFDPDKHAAMWISYRGEKGVPDSIRDLIKDAEDIKDMLRLLWHTLRREFIVAHVEDKLL